MHAHRCDTCLPGCTITCVHTHAHANAQHPAQCFGKERGGEWRGKGRGLGGAGRSSSVCPLGAPPGRGLLHPKLGTIRASQLCGATLTEPLSGRDMVNSERRDSQPLAWYAAQTGDLRVPAWEESRSRALPSTPACASVSALGAQGNSASSRWRPLLGCHPGLWARAGQRLGQRGHQSPRGPAGSTVCAWGWGSTVELRRAVVLPPRTPSTDL